MLILAKPYYLSNFSDLSRKEFFLLLRFVFAVLFRQDTSSHNTAVASAIGDQGTAGRSGAWCSPKADLRLSRLHLARRHERRQPFLVLVVLVVPLLNLLLVKQTLLVLKLREQSLYQERLIAGRRWGPWRPAPLMCRRLLLQQLLQCLQLLLLLLLLLLGMQGLVVLLLSMLLLLLLLLSVLVLQGLLLLLLLPGLLVLQGLLLLLHGVDSRQRCAHWGGRGQGRQLWLELVPRMRRCRCALLHGGRRRRRQVLGWRLHPRPYTHGRRLRRC